MRRYIDNCDTHGCHCCNSALSREGWLVRGHCSLRGDRFSVRGLNDLLLPSRAARLDRSIPLLIAHATAASNWTASCSDRASRSFAAGCAPRHAWASAEQLDRRQTVDRRTRQDNRRRSLPTVFRETKPASQSHCHLHSYFLRLPAKQLLFNCCPQMPTDEADNCMQNTASITAQYG